MQKIGFCDRYGLTQAVLNGTKTMTRRVEKGLENLEEGNFCYSKHDNGILLYGEKGSVIETIRTRYKLGEVVAVAQNYNDAAKEAEFNTHDEALSLILLGKQREKGWTNKMFVRPDLMPHQIKITGIKVERLQDITVEDCLKEGIINKFTDPCVCGGWSWNKDALPFDEFFCTPREAFASLINRPGVGRKGLWEYSPFVVVYEFKLLM